MRPSDITDGMYEPPGYWKEVVSVFKGFNEAVGYHRRNGRLTVRGETVSPGAASMRPSDITDGMTETVEYYGDGGATLQ